MGSNYDIIVVGGGQHGLGVAGYMAKAGKKVLLLEAHDMVGGGVITKERGLPGFRYDLHSTSHIYVHSSPLFTNDELGLFGKFGLKYQYADMAVASIFLDQSAVCLYHSVDKTCASIAQHSQKDADTYRTFAEWSARMLPVMMMGAFTVPTPMGPFMSVLEQSDDGRILLDMMLKSPLQVVDDYFENDKVKMAMLRLVIEHSLSYCDDMGTGISVAFMPAVIHSHKFGRPIGGSGMLTQALAKSIEHHGGEIILNCEVTKILTSGGRAIGVETTHGQFMAKDAVVASIHPRRLPHFVDGLSDSLKVRAERMRSGGFGALKIDAALNEPLRYNAPAEVVGGGMRELIFANTLPDFLESFDCMRYGRLQLDAPITNATNSAGADVTRCPPGKGILYSSTMVPYHLADGGPQAWDRIKDEVADKVIAKLQLLVPNLTSANIIERHVDTPLDMERYSPNSFLEGNYGGLGCQFFHTGGLRPLPELAQGNVPGIDSLYLCGPFMHPGSGVFGVGRPIAVKVCEDLGIDFDKVASRPVA